DSFVPGGTFRAAVPGMVVCHAVLIVFPVRFIVLLIVADQIIQREPVVRRNKIYRRPRFASLAIKNIGRRAQTRRYSGRGRAALPKIAYRIAEFVIPLRPSRRKLSHLIAARAAIPGLRNQL